jgi:acyl dehydratase
MTVQPLASRLFTLNDQLEFARLSSDRNPVHLDADFARRTQMGAPVVHGIHSMLWALEMVLASSPFEIADLHVRFPQPLYLDEIAQVRVSSRTEASVRIEVMAAGTVTTAIKVSSRSGKVFGAATRRTDVAPSVPEEPADIPFEDMANQTGTAAVTAADDEIRKAFPALSDAMGVSAVCGLLATSQIVGMACPGRHSLFAGLDITRDNASHDERALRYVVSKLDARFRSLQIDISGSGLAGRLDAFARLPPPMQPDMTTISARVPNGVFAGQRALIIGGSRGLGEVTAKMIAAGGGHPIITYRSGQYEAEKVAAEIRQAKGSCDVIRYDALDPSGNQLDGIGAIDGCYYFATTKIFQRQSPGLYDAEKFHTFLNYYVDGFYALCTALAQPRPNKLGIFYPSTVAIDEETSGVAEYVMAKAAGEIISNYVSKSLPNLHVVSRRLPRVMTDQTATIGVASAKDALDVLLPVVYEVQKIARP